MSGTGIVVVGVDGTAAGLAATRWAAEAAQREGHALRLVHVVPAGTTLQWEPPLVPTATMRTVGWRSLGHARTAVYEVVGESVPVTSQLYVGGRVQGLVAHARDASLVVLGSRTRTQVAMPTGSVVAGVAARTRCPVVVVPELVPDRAEDAPVVVGVDDPAGSEELLRAAAGVASEQRRRLVVLHAWSLPTPYADVLSSDDEAAWRTSAAARLQDAVAAVDLVVGRAGITVDVRHARAAEALISVSHTAQEILIGRRCVVEPFGYPVSAVARAVVAHAACPVRVVPLPARPTPATSPAAVDEQVASPS
jgi:nucleotide-binding universal stress UspA family protein